MQTATHVLSLVRPETPISAHLAKWALRAMFLFGVMVALASQAAAAPEVFKASGYFENEKLSGTITIDTATGKVVSADLNVGEYVFQGAVLQPYGNIKLHFRGVGHTAYGELQATMLLTLPVKTLVDYEGGEIEGYPYSVFAPDLTGTYGQGIYLTNGRLSPTGPEVSPD
jgi:hypothetical protein